MTMPTTYPCPNCGRLATLGWTDSQAVVVGAERTERGALGVYPCSCGARTYALETGKAPAGRRKGKG